MRRWQSETLSRKGYEAVALRQGQGTWVVSGYVGCLRERRLAYSGNVVEGSGLTAIIGDQIDDEGAVV